MISNFLLLKLKFLHYVIILLILKIIKTKVKIFSSRCYMSEKKSNIKNNFNTKKSYLDIANNLTFLNNVEHSNLYNELCDEYIKTEIEFSKIEYTINNYYHSLHDTNSDIKKQRECDLLCFRIAYLLENKSFVLNPIVFKNIHNFLYKDIFEFS